jgi:ABC-type spermidine/putrescine transport system permease subunit II
LSRWPNVLRRITLPLITPGVLFAAVLVFLLTFGEVGTLGVTALSCKIGLCSKRYSIVKIASMTMSIGIAAAVAAPKS